MSAVVLVLAQLYGLLLAGWGARRAGLSPRVAEVLTRLVTDLTMPCLILATLLGRAPDGALLTGVLAALAGLAGSLGAAWVLSRRIADRRVRGSFLLAATFCNTGFLGIPLAAALWGPGSEGLASAVLVDAFTTTPLLNSVGVLLAIAHAAGPGGFDRGALVRLLRAPMFLAVPAGLLLRGVVPPWEVLGQVGGWTGPLVFLATGMRLRYEPGHAPLLARIVGIRAVVSPLVALAVLLVLGGAGEGARQAVLEVAMPTALMVPVIAARYGTDDGLAAAAVAATTALAPVWLLGWLWGVGAWL